MQPTPVPDVLKPFAPRGSRQGAAETWQAPRLPLEIILLIMRELVSDRPALSFEYHSSVRSTLLALALTSKTLLPYATNLLFEKAYVHTPTQLRLLGMAPSRNLKLVRSLYVQIGGARFSRPANLSLQSAATQLQNVLTGPILGGLERLALHFGFARSAYSSWDILQFDRSVKTAVQKIMPGLTEFAALERSIFYDLLPWVPTSFAKLKRLHLTTIQDVRHLSDAQAIFRIPNLTSLQIPHFDGFVDLEGLTLRHPQLDSIVLYHWKTTFLDGLPGMKRAIESQREEPIHFYVRRDGHLTAIHESLLQGDYMLLGTFREVGINEPSTPR